MTNSDQVERAISTLETQRALLGDDVVDITISTLREKLNNHHNNSLEKAVSHGAQRKQVTILFARITRPTSDRTDTLDTSQLGVLNALWRRLDEAITSQGGMIDKHVGNAVMGLFGVPTVHEDDPERAIRAALSMRAALSNFVQDMTNNPAQFNHDGEAGQEKERDGHDHLLNLQLRIGINTGPVLLGEVGKGDEYTVIGDAVNVASRLERVAKSGSILISHETYLLVRGVFQVESLGPVMIRGKSEPLPVYLVLGAKPRVFYTTGRGVEGVETRMVGRDKEMYQLQVALRTAVKSRIGQLITIIGDAGVGKSRLVHEYNNWLKALPYDIPVFKGRSDPRLSQMPYGLIRDLVTEYFDLQDTDIASAVEQKLVQGMSAFLTQDESDVRVRARTIAQLLGLALSDEGQSFLLPTQVMERAFDFMADYFEVVTAVSPAAIIFLEDLHWADEPSLDMVQHLAQLCQKAPLIIVCVSRPQPAQSRVWLVPDTAVAPPDTAHSLTFPTTTMQLAPLSYDESRQLVTDILRKLPAIPHELSHMIVTRAEGNPYFVEELIKVLIEDGIILTGEEEWRIQRSQLTRLRVPLTLNGVLQARLDRLSELERLTLQRAAVIGRVFWDSAVIHMNELADEPLHSSESLSALQALEKRELIFPRQNSIIAGAQAFIFKHAMLREVAYESVLLRQRPAYHKQVADWLVAQSGERVAEFAGIIAEHYEQAGENVRAADLYEMAANRSVELYNPDVAIDYYGRALSLLTDKTHEVAWQLRLQQLLGDLLQQRARLVEASQTYMTMRYTAEIDGDLASQAHAWNRLAGIQQEQGDYPAMLNSANQAEQVAWLVKAEDELAQALFYKSRAQAKMGAMAEAQVTAERALEVSKQVDDRRVRATALSQLCFLALLASRYDEAVGYLTQMEILMSEMPTDVSVRREMAYFKASLGALCNEMGRFDQSASYLLEALKLYRAVEHQTAVGNTLNLLGDTARLRGNPRAAIPLYREAMSVAEAIGDQQGTLYYRTNLGAALVELESYETAVTELQRVLKMAIDISRMVNWHGLLEVYSYLALAYMGNKAFAEAKSTLLMVYKTLSPNAEPKLAGFAWRIMGMVLAGLPADEQTLVVEGRTVNPAECFLESWKCIRELHGGETKPAREKALTLCAWSRYEQQYGDANNAFQLRQQAQKMAKVLGIKLPLLNSETK